MSELWTYEREAWAEGYETVCGVDEAGAGPLMGPVYAAAVILPRECEIEGLNDSKKLAEKKREALFDIIINTAVAYGIARIEAAEIDATDILSARMKAMHLAMEALGQPIDMALIDGNRDKGKSFTITEPHRLLVKGDSKSASIAAASILAKVSRDRYVVDVLDKQYPEYQFAKHKGYGTALHKELYLKYGPCPEHRLTFLKNWEAER
ncbi:MAG: ribonuclease HII [Oscillospiraceae bacterium]|nr:ribonuclease HII [Oscillospiraceae bacterium]